MNEQHQSSKRLQWLRSFVPSSVGVRVALAVNLLVLVCGISLLILDYQQEFQQRLAAKALALREQAMTFHQAFVGLNRASIDGQQRFINAVCERMNDEESPGHHFVVETGGRFLQSQAHHRDTEEQLQAMRSAGERTASGLEDTDLLVGKYAELGITVYIGERMANVQTEIQQRAVVRSVGIGVFGLLLALVVNLVINKLVHKPLRRLRTTINGIATGSYSKTTGRFDGVEFARVAAAVDSMSLSLARTEAHRKASLDWARRVQKNLLPHDGGGNGLDVAFFHRAAEDIAGDYLDIFPTSRGTTILCVADVVGHGIAPAMIAAMLKVLLLNAAEVRDNPGDMLTMINRRLTAVTLPEAFATMFLAEWIPATQSLHYANAGHEPALLVSKNSTPSLLNSTGSMVGIDATMAWKSLVIPIAHGDFLACWTDGITEARNSSDDLLGRDRLIAAIQRHVPKSPQDLLDLIDQTMLDHVADKSPTDDCTVLAVRFS